MASKPPSDWKSRLHGWAERAEKEARHWAGQAESTVRDLSRSPYAEKATELAAQVRDWSKTVAENPTVQAARAAFDPSPLWKEAARAAEAVRGTSAWHQLEEAAQIANEKTRDAARAASEQLGQLREDAELVLAGLEQAVATPDDREKVLSAARQVFGRLTPQLDRLADAVAVGTLQEMGAGLAGVQGRELVFVPGDGPVRAQLRVSRVVGQAARLAVGGHVGAYACGMYGPRELLIRPLERRGADLGLLALSLGFFQAGHGPSSSARAGGWLFELSAGLALGVPLLSDLSTFELEEVPLATYQLEPQEAEALEQALAQSPDRSQRRRVARMLMRDAHPKPS